MRVVFVDFSRMLTLHGITKRSGILCQLLSKLLCSCEPPIEVVELGIGGFGGHADPRCHHVRGPLCEFGDALGE